MRASSTMKKVMYEKGITIVNLADILEKNKQTLYNTFYNDRHSKGRGMTFELAAELFEAMGCEIVIRDKETGREY